MRASNELSKAYAFFISRIRCNGHHRDGAYPGGSAGYRIFEDAPPASLIPSSTSGRLPRHWPTRKTDLPLFHPPVVCLLLLTSIPKETFRSFRFLCVVLPFAIIPSLFATRIA